MFTSLSSNVCFLACFLANHPLPESVGYGLSATPLTTPFTSTQNGNGVESVAATSYPLRTQLLHFLLPVSLLEVNRSLGVGAETGYCRLMGRAREEAR